jgi:hypothetical protein
MSNIIKLEPNAALELSEGKKRQYHRESLKMIAQGVAERGKGALKIACGFWNERECGLIELEGMKLSEFADKMGIAESTLYGYLQVGDRLAGMRDNKNIPIISQKDVESIFSKSSANIQDFTVRGLFKAAKTQQAFEAYLLSGTIEEVKTEAAKLLKPRKLTDAEMEELEEKERKNAATSDRLNTWGHAYAISHGIHMNRETNKWEHEDGTPLTKRELTDLTSFSDGLQPWERALESLAHASADIYKTLHTQGELFCLYSQKENKKFEDLVDNHREMIQRRLDSVELMITRFREGDVAGAERAYKETIA